MTTIAYSTQSDTGEAKFFFAMACTMAAVIVAGFAVNLAAGRSSFDVPWLVHFHAWTMMGWVGIYVTQNALIFTDNTALHRRLGWIAVVWLPLVLVMGVLIIHWSLQARGGPPFFDQNQFLISNPLQLLGAVGLAVTAITVRRNTGWHRRLMFCSFAMLTGPGVGRLLPAPLFIPYAWYVVGVAPPVVFALVGVWADTRRYGRPHPAWFCGIATVLTLQVIADAIAYSPMGVRFTQDFLAGTPGAARSMAAFMPPM